MKKTGAFTKTLAILGTTLAWIPILAPVIFSLVAFIGDRHFRFDYLMPAEIFPIGLIGSLILLWAARRARSRQKLIGWSLVVAMVMPLGGQALAVATGLASGAREPEGIWWGLVLGALVVMILAQLVIAVGGILLLRDLFQRSTLKPE